MLISFKDIVQKYGKPKGVIHIGAHLMEERSDYLSYELKNTIWIEANPKVYSQIEFINDGSYSDRVYNYVISDVDNKIHNLHITNNGQSSSILELDKHRTHHPHIYVTEVLNVLSKRIDTLFSENSLDIKNYDFINIDIQGAELLALKGFGDLLNEVKYIYTEVNTNTLYKECALINEIDEYLTKFGFRRVETKMTEFEWGDAFYIK